MPNALSYDNAYNFAQDGTTVTSSGASQSTSIPNASDGNRARAVRLQVTGNLYVKFGKGATTATTNSALLSPNFDVIVNCRQFDTIAYLQETASAKLNIIPLET